MKKFIYNLFVLLLLSSSNMISAQCPSAGSITLSVSSTPNTCAGNGTITATLNSYDGVSLQLIKSGSILSQVGSTTSPLTAAYTWTNLQPGTDYQVKVICSDNQSIIYQTENATVADNYIPISNADITVSNVCTSFTPGGTITVNSVTGGTAPYTYSYYLSTDPGYDDSYSSYTSNSSMAVNQFGTYQIRVKDNCGNYKTFTRTIESSFHTLKVYFSVQSICSSTQANFLYSWAQDGETNQAIDPSSYLTDGVNLQIYASNDGVNPTGTALFDGNYKGQTLTFDMSPTHKYYITSTNVCGKSISYIADLTWEESYQGWGSASYSGCTGSESMVISGNRNNFWKTPIAVNVKNSGGTSVYTRTLNSGDFSWSSCTLPMDDYTVTYTDACAATTTFTVSNPINYGSPSLSADYELWRCGDGNMAPLSQNGTTILELAINGYLPDHDNAVVTITAGPSNVGVSGVFLDNGKWGWSNIIPGHYTFSVTSCSNTNFYSIDVSPGSNVTLDQSLTSTAQSFCSGGGNIISNYTFNGNYSHKINLYDNSGTLIDSNNDGNFYNLPAGSYTTKMQVDGWCANSTYYVDNPGTLTLTDASTGPAITSSVGVICEDIYGNPLSTGSAYLTLAGVAPYTLQYKLQGTGTWTTINNAPTDVEIDNLEANKVYDVLLTDGCGGTYNSTVNIKTMGALASENTVHPCYNQPYVLIMRYYAGASYEWLNPSGVVVSTSRSYYIPDYSAADDGTYTAHISWGTCVTRYVSVNINGNLCGTPITNPFVDAANDINQTPQGISVSGNALTNDRTSDGSTLIVHSATYLNISGLTTALTLGSSTQIYDESHTLAGTIVLNTDGTYTFNPTTTYIGTVPVYYTAANPSNYFDDATISIKVLPAIQETDNKPIAQNDVASTLVNTSVSSNVLINDKDPGNSTLTVISAGVTIGGSGATVSGIDYLGSTVANAGTLTLNNDGTYTFIPATDFVGYVDPVPYTISNTSGKTDSAILSITVFPLTNNVTFASDDANSAAQGNIMTGNILTNDKDPEGNGHFVTSASVNGNSITIGTQKSLSGIGTLIINSDGSYIFTPLLTFVGTVVVPYSVCDDNSTSQACAQATLYLTELPIELTTPVAVDDINTTFVNTPVNGNVLTNDTDPENDPLIVNTTPTTNPLHGTVILNSDGTYTYTPNSGYIGEDTFTYQVCDPSNNCDGATVTIQVFPIPSSTNNPPVANNDAYTGVMNTQVNGNVMANDFDPDNNLDANSATLINGGTAAANGTLTLNPNGTFTYAPNSGFTGKVSFTYQISDLGTPIYYDNAEVTIDILPITTNTTDAVDDAYFTEEDTPINGNIMDNDYDPEGNNQTVNTTPIVQPQHGTVVLNSNGTFTYTPSKNYYGQDQFVYEVCDDGTPVACDKATVYLNISPVDDGPVAVDDINTTFINTAVDGNVLTNDTDPENDPLTVNTTPITNPLHGTVVLNSDGTYTYTPNSGYVGEDTFTYRVCDPSGNCDEATVTIDVIPIPIPLNDPPVANNDAYTGVMNTQVHGNVMANDFDPDNNINTTIGATITNTGTAGSNGSLNLNPDGTFTYNPNPGFIGKVNFTYQICDLGTPVYCDEAEVTIDILPLASNTTDAVDDAYYGEKNNQINGNVKDNDYDPEGNNQTVNTTPIVQPQHGTVTLNSNGTFTYTPTTDYTGHDQFVYEICDDGTPVACDKATVYLQISPIIPKLWYGGTSTDFNTATNWTMGEVPGDGDDVEFATATNNNGNPAVRDMVIPEGSNINIGNLTNESDKATIIPSATSLTILGEVNGSETDPSKMQILANNDGTTPNGTLILSGQPCAHVVQGTVQMYAKGYKGSLYTWVDDIVGSPTFGVTYKGYYKWQQFGVPVASVTANPTFYGSYLREYSETLNNDTTYYKKWITLNNSSVLTGNFKGYEITQDVPKIIVLQGALVFCNKDIVLTRTATAVTSSTDPNVENYRYGLGQNVFGNSFTAAIDISTLTFPADVEQTVYLYNTGSFGDWGNNNSTLTNTNSTAGAYRAIPYNVSSVVGNQIPSMQGFLLRHLGSIGSEITMSLPYNQLIKNINPQSAPKKTTKANNLSYIEIDLNSESTNDKLWLFSQDGTTSNFDNGWDGRKFFGTPTAYIYTPTVDGNMQINANNNIVNSYINFIGNSDSEYILTLKKVNLDDKYSNLYLVDYVTNTITPLDKDEVTYKFTANNNGTEVKRFQIKGQINPSDNDPEIALSVYSDNNKIYVTNNSQDEGTIQLFDVSGKMILATKLKPLQNEPLSVKLITGVYLVKLNAGKYNNTVKVIIK